MPADVLTFSNVSKRFRTGGGQDSLAELVTVALRGLTFRKPRERNVFWALRGIDFSVARGEAVGIVGPNGAGKSTALKLIAGILEPDIGHVSVRGRLAALIEVGAGFHGDLSGRENVYLNGAILGMSRAEIRSKLDDIVAFAGIERFIDTPVKRYSSGMYARLGFSIAAHVEPEILLVDEVLSVGDAVFRLRCHERMASLVEGGTTLVFVTHNLDQMQSICGRAIVLRDGRTAFIGDAREAAAHYMAAMSCARSERPADIDAEAERGGFRVRDLSFHDDSDHPVVWLAPDRPIAARVHFTSTRRIERLVLELNMRSPASEHLVSLNSGRSGKYFDVARGASSCTLRLPRVPVAGGHYFWNVRAWDADTGEVLADTPFQYAMVADDGGKATGAICLEHEWSRAVEQHGTEGPHILETGAIAAGDGSTLEDLSASSEPRLTRATEVSS